MPASASGRATSSPVASMWRTPISLDTVMPPPCSAKLSRVREWLVVSTGSSCRPWRLQARSIIWRIVVSAGGKASGCRASSAKVRLVLRASACWGGSTASTGAVWRCTTAMFLSGDTLKRRPISASPASTWAETCKVGTMRTSKRTPG